MRLATLTSVALLLSAGYALAQQSPNTMTSGRPSAVLDDAQCQAVWQMASPMGRLFRKIRQYPTSSILQWLMATATAKLQRMSSKQVALREW